MTQGEAGGYAERDIRRAATSISTYDMQLGAFFEYFGRTPNISFEDASGRCVYTVEWDEEADRIRGDYKRDTAVNMERFKKVFNALRDRRDAVRAQYGIGTPFRHLNGARGKPTRGTGEDECRTEEVSSET